MRNSFFAAIAWFWQACVSGAVRLWSVRRDIAWLWLLFGINFVLNLFWAYIYFVLAAVVVSLLNALSPDSNFVLQIPQAPPAPAIAEDSLEPFLKELRTALPRTVFSYITLIVPSFLLFKTRNVETALPAFDPRIIPNTIQILRGRAAAYKVYAAIAVVLIVATLYVGVMLFAGPTTYTMTNETTSTAKDKEPPATKIEYHVKIEEDTNSMISSMVKRIGAVAIIVFLVSVLVFLFRTNIKQATFNDRLADALQLAGTNQDELKKYIDMFFLKWVEFENPPRSPFDQLAKAFQGAERLLDKKKL